MAETIAELMADVELVTEVKSRWAATESYQSQLRNRYRRQHHYFAPPYGDQWPEDAGVRPGMIHITHNVIRPAVETEARIESKLPRTTLQADGDDEETRERAEKAEKMMLRFLEISGWDVWLHDLNVTRGIYGKGILKPFWDDNDKRPDVVVLEQPGNLRLGWGSSDYTVLDWAIYEYKLSPLEVMRRYPAVVVEPSKGDEPLSIRLQTGDHSDPLDTLDPVDPGSPRSLNRPYSYQESDYEQKQVVLWDYWYKGQDGIVRNAHFLNGVLIKKGDFPYYPDLPYIVVELDHEPGSPEGLGIVEDLIDVQYELNRALSHFAQLVADEVDPAWQLTGENADAVPAGMVPKGGEIQAAGAGNKIEPISKGVNQFPIEQLIDMLYKSMHFGTGLPEIMFSMPPGAQTAGRALQIQIEASANRLEQRRNRLYEAVKKLLIFWTYMLEKKNPKILVGYDEDSGEPMEEGVGDLVRGFRRWKLVAPEITPRDVIENTSNVINKLNAKIIDLETAMDELGVDSPMEIKKRIEAERSNPSLFPADAQAKLAVTGLMFQLMQQMQAMGIDPAALGLPGGAQPGLPPGPGGMPPEAGGPGNLEAAGQMAQPGGLQGDNAEAPTQPMTQAGMPPPPGAGLQNQSLIRGGPSGSQVLNQIKTVAG